MPLEVYVGKYLISSFIRIIPFSRSDIPLRMQKEVLGLSLNEIIFRIHICIKEAIIHRLLADTKPLRTHSFPKSNNASPSPLFLCSVVVLLLQHVPTNL